MACELSMQCDLWDLKCSLAEDTLDVGFKVCTLHGIHTFRKDRSIQIIKYSPWGN